MVATTGHLEGEATRAERLAPLDALRGVAILLVVVLHVLQFWARSTDSNSVRSFLLRTEDTWSFGLTGVHLFFVLSAFLLFTPYAVALRDGARWPSLRRYGAKRFLRVAPLYWLAVVVLLISGLGRLTSDDRVLDGVLHVAFVHNIRADTELSIAVPFWTLAVEAQFYVVLPALALVFRRVGFRPGLLMAAAVAAASVSMLANHVLHRVLESTEATRDYASAGSLLAFLPVFLCGVAASVAWAARPDLIQRSRLILLVGATAVLGLQAAAGHLGFGYYAANLYPFNFLSGIGYGLLLLVAVTFQSGPLALRSVGLASFSIYLTHWTVLAHLADVIASDWYPIVAALSVSVVGAAVWNLCERPIERLRAKWT